MSLCATFLFHLSACVALSCSFYLPGSAPVTLCRGNQSDQYHCSGSKLRIFANRLNTARNILPYKYDDFDFCGVADNVEDSFSENIGQKLLGDRIQPSKYTLEFGQDVMCKKACKKTYSPGNEESMQKLTFLKFAINLQYQHHWIVDNLPVTWCYEVAAGNHFCSLSLPVGCYVTSDGIQENACVISARYNERDTFYLFNHIDIVVQYQPSEDVPDGGEAGRITSVTASPKSIKHKTEGPDGCDISAPPMSIPGKGLNSTLSFHYSYSVYWRRNTLIQWSYRWDFLLDPSNQSVSWFSLMNSTIVVLFLSGILVRIFIRHLSKASGDNTVVILEREMGWTLIEGDVFRPPQNVTLLSVFVSNGIQLSLTAFVTLLFATMGFLSPANPGALFTCILISCLCCSPISGYISARIYKNIGGVRWMLNALLTVFLCPGLIFLTLFLLNCILKSKGSSAALPTWYMVKMIGCWFGISLLLTFVGAFFGNRRQADKNPVSVNESPRPILRRSVFCSAYLLPFWGSGLLFSCVFIQLFFILTTLWQHTSFYCQFIQLFLMFVLLFVTCCEISMILCFMQLKSQDYHWWWRSFVNSGWLGFYVLLYCTFFFFRKLDISDDTSVVLYFGYTAIIGFLVFLSSGSIGFIACYWLVFKMYSRFQGTK